MIRHLITITTHYVVVSIFAGMICEERTAYGQPDQGLSQDTVLSRDYPPPPQVAELTKIVDFFDRHVKQKTGVEDVAQAYRQFNKMLGRQRGVSGVH